MHTRIACLSALLMLLQVGAGLAADPAASGGTGRQLAEGVYSLEDFRRIEKIDAHLHLHGAAADAFMEQAAHDGFRVLTINVDYPDFPPIDVQQREAVALKQRYAGRVAFAATISVAGFGSADWADGQIHHLDEAFGLGAVGVKVWKNIGLNLRDSDGRYVMLDDPRLKPIFDHLESQHVVLLGHQAEPLNCWLPFDKMTVRSDREYFQAHPQYYMYQHPEVPSHEAQLAARDRMLTAHPALQFDGVHLASLEWDVDEVAHFLDRFPNAKVDMAARISHLEYQASRNRKKVRQFLLRYQDRILYGTDIAVGPTDAGTQVAKEAHETWLQDWRFLTTRQSLKSNEFAAPFCGLALPRTVVDKIYRLNAQQMFPRAWPSTSN